MSIIHVHRWISKKEKISYKFGDVKYNPDIPLVIFQDDSLNKAITKIAYGILQYHKVRGESLPNITSIPYIWVNNKSLRFELDSDIPANPWNNEEDITKINKNKQINYIEDSIIIHKTLNIVFINDIPEKLIPYYFPDGNTKWKPEFSVKEIFKESKNLNDLWNIIENDPDEKRSFVFSKLRFIGNINKIFKNDSINKSNYLDILFETIHTSSQFPFFQYIQDSSRILYKIWKNHSISSSLIQNWSYYDKLPKVEMIIAMIPLLEREHSFARCTIDTDGNITIQYQIDSRDKIEWEVILNHVQSIKKWFEQLIKTNIIFKINAISGKGEFATQGISLQDISKYIGKGIFIPLYHVIKLQDNILTIAYKRSQNYHNQIDIADYISSNIKLGISLQDIAQNLIDLGLTQKEVTQWIEQYQTQVEAEIDLPKKKSIAFSGCIFKFEKNPYGFRVLMENVATFEELQFIYHWLRSTFKYIMEDRIPLKAPPAPPASPPAESKSRETEASQRSGPSQITQKPQPPKIVTKKESSVSSEEESDSNDLFNQEIEFEGGASKKGKGTDRYFLTQLQQADPAIFLDTKNYARLCGANIYRQPIVVTPEEKEKIDREGYSNAYDDSILYGSDKQHLNHYMCPRIWCPTSRIPLTEKQLEDNGGKCPGPHFEKPMKLYEKNYWDDNPKIPHHIGFHKQKTPAGLCLPCCMKNPLKEKEIADCKVNEDKATGLKTAATTPLSSPRKRKTGFPSLPPQPPSSGVENKGDKVEGSVPVTAATPQMKEDGYIMGAVAPLPNERFGAIPKDLHTFLQPNIPYQLCSKTISSSECYLRKGIQHSGDSLMNAIATSLGMSNKKELIKYIIKNLNPLKFISLGNGYLLSSFMLQEPIIPSKEHKLIKQWSDWIKDYKYTNYINMLGGFEKIQNNETMLSRELAIYKAYMNFINYLQSNDLKNPEHLEIVLLSINILLLIWKRQDNVATLQCSTYSHVDDIFKAGENKKIAMLLEENQYYEPIELKQRNKQGMALFDIHGQLSKQIKSILKQCPLPYTFEDDTYSNERTFIENIRNLIAWSSIRLFNENAFIIKSVILRQDLQIYGFLTRGNLLIRGPQEGIHIHILPELFDIIPTLTHMLYIEDIANNTYKISELFINDYELFSEKIDNLGFMLNSGNISSLLNKSDNDEIIDSGELHIEPLNLSIIPTIRTITNDTLYMNENTMKKIDKQWTQLQYAIGNTLLKYYNTLVKPLLNKSRKERIRILMNTFPKLPDKVKIQTILEEIPIEYGKKEIAKWIHSINLEKKNKVFTSSLVESTNNDKEWRFSQAAVENGLPIDVLKPVKSIHPNEKYTQNRVIDYKKDEESDSKSKSLLNNLPSPSMLVKSQNDLQSLPTKWNTAKGHNWNKYNWYKLRNYKKESLPELFEWISRNINAPFEWNEIKDIRNKLIIALLQNKEATLKLLEDPSILNAWKVSLKKKYKDGNHLWTKSLEGIKYKERVALWNTVLQKDIENNLIWPTDLDLKTISSLMNIGILVIYRSKYGEGIDVDKKQYLDDLYISSTFYHGTDWKKRPCIILFRNVEKEHITYSAVVHSDGIFIHKTAQNMSSAILELLEFHTTKESKSSSISSTHSSTVSESS